MNEDNNNDFIIDNINKLDKNDSSGHHFKSNSNYFTLSVYALAVIIIGTLAVKIIFNFSEISTSLTSLISTFSSFVVAFFIAYIVNPIVKLVDKYILERLFRIKNEKVRMVLSILLSYIVLITSIILLLTYIIPEFVTSLKDLSGQLSQLFTTVYDRTNKVLLDTQKRFPNLNLSYIEDEIQNSLPQLFKSSSDLITSVMGNLANFSVSVITTTISIIIAIVISTYMIADRHIIAKNATKFVYTILPIKTAESFCCTVKECNQIFYNFVIGKALDSLIIGVITFILMSILRLNYSLMISIIVGITNMIPYFGPFIGAVPGVLILFVVSPVKGLIFAILILIIQQFDGLYLGPKILGGSVGLSPLWVIFGISLGGAIMGVLGMFIGVPLVAVLSHLVNKFMTYKLKGKNLDDAYFDKIVHASVEEIQGKPPKQKSRFFYIFSKRKYKR